MRAPLTAFVALLAVAVAVPSSAANRFQNPEFDGSLAGWALGVGENYETHWPAMDADGCAQSGSARLEGKLIADYGEFRDWISQCVPATQYEIVRAMSQVYLEMGSGVTGRWTLDFYNGPACTGLDMGAAACMAWTLGWHEWKGVPGDGWSLYTFPATLSVRATLTFISGSPFAVNVDRTYFGGPDPLFENGFEAGFCRFAGHT